MVSYRSLFVYVSIGIIVLSYWLRTVFKLFKPQKRATTDLRSFSGTIAFFHPFCNDCGGGERVLWFMIAQIQKECPNAILKIFVCDKTEPDLIIEKASKRFNVNITRGSVEFVYLDGKGWILPQAWKHFTLFGQTIGSVILGFRAAIQGIPDVLIDTTGFVFFGAIMKLMGCPRFGAYIHYPTISADMISRVEAGKRMYNNAGIITSSKLLTNLKFFYYKLFALWYRLGGKFVDYTLTNSHWTYNHIKKIWRKDSTNSLIVYPPCSPHFFEANNLERKPIILSLSQFRPEKDHKKQIDILYNLIQKFPSHPKIKNIQLWIVGGVRTEEDQKYLDSIQNYVQEKGLDENVVFKININFAELRSLLSRSMIGIHVMVQEHFGIGIVEMMASGLIVVAHKSGGPESDIIVDYKNQPTGFLADTVDEYVSSIHCILEMGDEEIFEFRTNAIKSVNDRFKGKLFNDNITMFIEKLVL